MNNSKIKSEAKLYTICEAPHPRIPFNGLCVGIQFSVCSEELKTELLYHFRCWAEGHGKQYPMVDPRTLWGTPKADLPILKIYLRNLGYKKVSHINLRKPINSMPSKTFATEFLGFNGNSYCRILLDSPNEALRDYLIRGSMFERMGEKSLFISTSVPGAKTHLRAVKNLLCSQGYNQHVSDVKWSQLS